MTEGDFSTDRNKERDVILEGIDDEEEEKQIMSSYK
jgi:hypothetical protein